jgi:Na+/phosphate symporter
MLILIAIAIFIIIRTHVFHTKKQKDISVSEERSRIISLSGESIYKNCLEIVTQLLLTSAKIYNRTVSALKNEKRKKLKEELKTIKSLSKESKDLKKDLPVILNRLTEEDFDHVHHYTEIINYTREIVQCLSKIANPAFYHVDNNHTPLSKFQDESLTGIGDEIKDFNSKVVDSIKAAKLSAAAEIMAKANEIAEKINLIIKKQLKIIEKEPGSTRTNILFLDILTESKNFIQHVSNLHKSYREFAERNKELAEQRF